MAIKHFAAALLGTLLMGTPSGAQSAVDLLQKGIHAQETVGDLDEAIRIFRQITGSPSNNKLFAAQAQYQLVVCMLQKGDRAAASREVELLARDYPEQQDLLARARKLLPVGAALLPAPWGEGEASQLNIKRDGVATGERLFYSVDPDTEGGQPANPQNQVLRWELITKNSRRSVTTRVDRATMDPAVKPNRSNPLLDSDDLTGDPAAATFNGPAIDVEQSIFRMRRLPLAPGYKATLASLPFTLGSYAPKQVEITVTGIETVETPAGRFKCYTVSAAGLGQTFWVGIEGARPLVRFRAGNVEAELVQVWGPENALERSLAFVTATGGSVAFPHMGPRNDGRCECPLGAAWRAGMADEGPHTRCRDSSGAAPCDGRKNLRKPNRAPGERADPLDQRPGRDQLHR